MSITRKKIGALALTALLIATPSIAGTAGSADVQGFPGFNVSGTSTMFRSYHGVGMTATIDGLTPGYPYTVWAVIFNRPHNCIVPNECSGDDVGAMNPAVDIVFTLASRNYSDDSGSTVVSGFVPRGAALKRPNRAEVHFVYRRHPDIDGQEYPALNSGIGNCPGPNSFGPNINTQCLDLGFAVHR